MFLRDVIFLYFVVMYGYILKVDKMGEEFRIKIFVILLLYIDVFIYYKIDLKNLEILLMFLFVYY